MLGTQTHTRTHPASSQTNRSFEIIGFKKNHLVMLLDAAGTETKDSKKYAEKENRGGTGFRERKSVRGVREK